MKKKNLVIAAIVALIVIGGAGIYLTGKDDIKTTSSSSATQSSESLVDKNSSDYKTYSEVTGDDYDRLFLANMIAHHQGAVDMANLALTNAKHQELKDMANDIISAQTSEISNMIAWQKSWGYPASSGEMMMDHSSMGMMDSMAGMTDKLKGLTGDEFDKAFLSSMIEHHQSAISMAAPGKTNALHQEVKDLTAAIITAQTKEIKQMQQWQVDWGY